MISAPSLRARMMLLFCAVVGILLTGSYVASYAIFARVVRSQFDRRLQEAANPVIADLIQDTSEQDVNELNLPGEYFELLDASGRVLQHSRNLQTSLFDPQEAFLETSETVFRVAEGEKQGRLRIALVPFRQGKEFRVLAVAMPYREIDRLLENFRQMILVLLPVSLVLTALISAWYAGRSLKPIADLTRRAVLMTEQVGRGLPSRGDGAEALPAPLRAAGQQDKMDEVGRLAATFNQLFATVDAALGQLRQFVSDASHELRTPLSVLQGETELLLSEPRSSEEYQRALAVIDSELKKLSHIVEGLFTLAMADAGQLRLTAEPLYLNEVLEETCALVAQRAKAKSITVERALGEEVPCTGDEVFLRQLFLIFLENAIKYSPPNSRVRVTLETLDGNARVKFEDQGIGISSEHLPRIFDRFYRAAKPESGEAQSGGLGLAIAQAVARAQGGSIECSSRPGAGSSFTVALPLRSQRSAAISG